MSEFLAAVGTAWECTRPIRTAATPGAAAMAPSPDDFDQTLPPAGSPRARERGLRRARRLTRWLAVTAVAATAALGGFYTHLVPGSSPSAAPSPPPGQSPPTSSAAREDDEAGAADDDEAAAVTTRPAPQAPAQPPTSTQQKPHTTTGAS
ncbi:hypothetical protein GCM10010508_37620 [Streptomyces naganishii JCM 4654]|uniref:Uncharacterized protein n=2 Tax=Streptomyces naganishii TaxID=285447 RepID=A0A918Y6K0_9ACTN|nr:hypothetical protein GCM10010508_37620 [Streptomyces naganishii JCM 4654]